MFSIDLRCDDCRTLGVLCPVGKARGDYRCWSCGRAFHVLRVKCGPLECPACDSEDVEIVDEEDVDDIPR